MKLELIIEPYDDEKEIILPFESFEWASAKDIIKMLNKVDKNLQIKNIKVYRRHEPRQI